MVAPLNWGIGHATRCIPIIKELLEKGYQPVIASDGDALLVLQKEFPNLCSYNLPPYKIEYAKKGYLLKLKLLIQAPKLIRIVQEEYVIVQRIIEKENIQGIISDNRFGVYCKKTPSIYMTHQLRVYSGLTTFLTTWIHQRFMRKFDEIWVPSTKDSKFSGKLSSSKIYLKKPIHYIGILNRFLMNNIKSAKLKYDLLVLLSGPEPQRTILEKKLILQLQLYSKKVLFIRGVLNKKELKNTNSITFINFITQDKLQESIINSDVIISRSGYSTLMDLAVLQKKVFFIPTPGQSEQIYLAKHIKRMGIAPFSKQEKFDISQLKSIDNYTGFTDCIKKIDLPLTVFE